MAGMPAGIRTYVDNAAKASGKSEKEMLAVLSKSGLKTHGELRSHAMEALGLGHGHANALAAYYLKPEWQAGATSVCGKEGCEEEGACEKEVQRRRR